MEKVFEQVTSVPLFAVFVEEEEIVRQVKRKFLYRTFRGTPNEPRAVKDEISGSGLQSLETSGPIEHRRLKTLRVRVAESNQRGRGIVAGRPLEPTKSCGDGGGGGKIGRVL